MCPTSPRRGFTLIELLASISVIAVLAVILFSVINTAIESAGTARCTSNLRNIGVAVRLFVQENGNPAQVHQGKDEDGNNLGGKAAYFVRLVDGGFIDGSADSFNCPNNDYPDSYSWQTMDDLNLKGITYGWNNALQDGHIQNASHVDKSRLDIYNDIVQSCPMVVCMDTSPAANALGCNVNSSLSSRIGYHHQGQCNVLFVDLHVEMKPPETMEDPAFWTPSEPLPWY